MKVVVQIPCFNEEKTLGLVLDSLPRSIPNVDSIVTVVIDDGSTDGTVRIAQKHNADYILQHRKNYGLGTAFESGICASRMLDADVIVNIDGDNQYSGEEVAKIVTPIVDGQSAVVIGSRTLISSDSYTPTKRLVHWLMTRMLNWLLQLNVSDPVSGFRAFSAQFADELIATEPFSHTIDNLILASTDNWPITCIGIQTKEKLRPSRLASSSTTFLWKQLGSTFSALFFWRPNLALNSLSLFCFIVIFMPNLFRVIYYLFMTEPDLRMFKIGSGIFMAIGAISGIVFFLGSVLFAASRKYRKLSVENHRLLRQLSAQNGQWWRLVNIMERTISPPDQGPVYRRIAGFAGRQSRSGENVHTIES